MRFKLFHRNSIEKFHRNQKPPSFDEGFFGAATQIRTGDLILTKDVLYQLSHSSVFASTNDIITEPIPFVKRNFHFSKKILSDSAQTVRKQHFRPE